MTKFLGKNEQRVSIKKKILSVLNFELEKLATKENWSLSVQMTEHCRLKHLAMSATKVVLEWTKAVTFIVTLVFMLLVFGLEQGLHHYRPTLPYTMLTWSVLSHLISYLNKW